MVPVVAGIALTFKMRNEPRVALTWVGDGSTKTAAAHEGTNFAAVQRVPAIFIVQNNQVALGTRLEQHHLPGTFERLAGILRDVRASSSTATTCSTRRRRRASRPSAAAPARGR